MENNFFRVQPGHIYHICGGEEGFSAPPSFKLALYPASPSPLLIHSQKKFDANIRQGRTEELFFLFKLGCFNFTPPFFIRFYWWVIESNKSIFSVFQGVSSKRITSNVSFDVFLCLINTIMWFDLTYGKWIILKMATDKNPRLGRCRDTVSEYPQQIFKNNLGKHPNIQCSDYIKTP